jgi:predicted transcriptional regulator
MIKKSEILNIIIYEHKIITQKNYSSPVIFVQKLPIQIIFRISVYSLFIINFDYLKIIISEYIKNTNSTFTAIAKKFKMPKMTVSRVIKRYLETGTVERKRGSGGYCPGNVQRERKVIQYIRSHPNASLTEMASKFGTCRGNIIWIKQKYNIVTRKVRKIPNRDDLKNTIAKRRARKL